MPLRGFVRSTLRAVKELPQLANAGLTAYSLAMVSQGKRVIAG